MIRCLVTAAGMFFASALGGCGGYTPDDGVIVTGRVVQGGQPISAASSPDGSEGVEVQISPAAVSETPLVTSTTGCDASGSFEFTYAGRGVPPGRYKLTVSLRSGEGATGAAATAEVDVPQDKLGGRHDVGVLDIATMPKTSVEPPPASDP